MWIEICLAVIAIVAYLYWKAQVSKKFWPDHGIYPLPTTFKDSLAMIGQNINFNVLFANCYDKAKKDKKEGIFGIGGSGFPMLVISDPDILRQIFVKDFDNFVDRNVDVFMNVLQKSNLKADRIWANTLVNLTGDRWKEVRSTFSPIFTSGRMKAMTVLMKESVHQLVGAFNRAIPSNGSGEFELKEIIGKYSMDVIASCAFGVNARTFSEDEADKEFVGHASRVFRKPPYDTLKNILIQVPRIGFSIIKALKLPFIRENEINFFYDVVKQTLTSRIQSKSKRNDIIDLMIEAIRGELKQDTEHEDSDYEKEAKLNHNKKLSSISPEDEEIIMVATAMVMLVAGYDTTALTMSYACHELAMNQDVQERLREEVDEAYGKKDDDACVSLDYSDVQFMEYLDQVLSETLRKHPVAGMVTRSSVKDYKIQGTGMTIPKQTMLVVPTLAIHRDPKNYPEPEKFDPDRFSKEEKAKRQPYTYLPFGQGPRSCIGMRFAQLEAKLGLAALVRHFEILPCPKTEENIQLDTESFLVSPKHLWVSFRKRF